MLNPQNVKLAIAPIAWTNDDMPDLGKENTFEQCISEMALAGFQGSEIGNKYPDDIEILKHKLSVRSLQICNAWCSTFFTSEPYEVTIDLFKKQLDKLHALGAKVIGISEQGNSIQGKLGVSIFDQKPIYTDEQWKIITKGFNEMGQIAKDKDMFLTVHHHMGTGIQTAEEIDKLMELTDPSLVYLLFDTGHLLFTDVEPMDVLNKYIDRVKHVHLKDIRFGVLKKAKAENMCFLDAVRSGVFTVPGDGDYDYTNVFDALEKANYKGWMVVEAEQDPAKANPFEYALKAKKYIKEKTGL